MSRFAPLVQTRRPRPGRTFAILGALGLVVALAGSPRWDGAGAQVNTAELCGTAATGWSTATVDGFQGTVADVDREADLMGAGTAPAAERLVVTLELTNASSEVISLRQGTVVAVLTCDGEVLSPNAGATIDPEALDMAPGATLEIPFTFILPLGSEPERLVVRREEPDRCLGQLGFPLAIPEPNAVTPTVPAGEPTPAANAFATCDGGMATTGASFSGTSDDGSTTGGIITPDDPGSDATGSGSADSGSAGTGSATGGRGCDGEDAIGAGSGASGGDGGDGGAAVSGAGAATGVDVVGADCTPEARTSTGPRMTS